MKKLVIIGITTILILSSCGGLSKNKDKDTENINGGNGSGNTQNTQSGEVSGINISKDENGNKKVSDPKYNYEVSFPAIWEQKELAGLNGFVLTSPLTSTGDLFTENVNFLSQDYTSLGNFDEFYKENVKQIEAGFKEYNIAIKSQEDVTLPAGKAKKIVYTFDINGTSIQTTQYFMDHNSVAYLITVSNDAKNLDNFKDDIKMIVDSFRFKD